MATYEELIRRYGGQPIQFGETEETEETKTLGQPATPLQAGAQGGQAGGRPERSYEELVRSYGAEPIRFPVPGSNVAGASPAAARAPGGAGAPPQGRSPGAELIDAYRAQLDSLLAERSAIAKDPARIASELNDNLARTRATERILSQLADAEVAAGRRPGKAGQLAASAMETVSDISDWITRTIMGVSRDELAQMRGERAAAAERSLREEHTPTPATPGEGVSQFAGRVVPWAAIGAASAPLQTAGAAAAGAEAGAKRTIGQEIAGQLAQEAAMVPITFGSTESTADAALATVLGPILGTFMSRGLQGLSSAEKGVLAREIPGYENMSRAELEDAWRAKFGTEPQQVAPQGQRLIDTEIPEGPPRVELEEPEFKRAALENEPEKFHVPDPEPEIEVVGLNTGGQARKNQAKQVVQTELAEGRLTPEHSFRGASREELERIASEGRLQVGESFEGEPGISAARVGDGQFPVYGDEGVGILAPPGASRPSGRAGEVLLDENTDPRSLRYVVDGKVVRFEELPGALRPEPPGVAGGGKPFQDVAEAGKFSDETNLNLERISPAARESGDPNQVMQEMHNQSRIMGIDIHLVQGPRHTWEEVSDEVFEITRSPEKLRALLNKPKGSAYTDTEAMAIREIYVRQADQITSMQKRFARGEIRARDMAQALSDFLELRKRVTAAAAEAGRSLNIFRRIATGEVDLPEGALRDMVEFVKDMDPEAMGKFVDQVGANKAWTPTISDKLYEWFVNSLVSASHGVNSLSNMVTYFVPAVERTTAATIDLVTSVGGLARPREVYFREVPELVKFTGAGQGLRHAWRRLASGTPQGPAQSSKVVHREALTGPAGAIRYIGSRALGAEDEFFSTIGYYGEVHAQVTRRALQEGHRGQALQKRVAELLNKIPDDIHQRAVKSAQENTFTNETLLGNVSGKVKQFDVGKASGAGVSLRPMRWISPFTSVSSSIVTRGVESSPVGFLTVPLRRSLKGGTGRTLAEDLARPTVGTALGFTAWHLRQSGTLTGSRRPDANERNTLYSDGWQPNSIRIGDEWVNLERFEIVGTILTGAANAIDAFERGDDEEGNRWMKAIASTIREQENDTWMRSMSEVLGAIENAEMRDPGKLAARQLAGFYPNILRRVGKEFTDPIERKTEGFSDTLLRELDTFGVLEPAQPRLDPFGRVQGDDKTTLVKLANVFGFPTSTAKNDPVVREHLRVGAAMGDVGLTASLEDDIDERELFDQDKAGTTRFRQAKGQLLYHVDEEVMRSKRYLEATDDEKMTMLRRSRSMAGNEWNNRWRKAGRPFDTESLDEVSSRVRVRSLVSRITNLRGIDRLTPAEPDRFQGEFREEDFQDLMTLTRQR